MSYEGCFQNPWLGEGKFSMALKRKFWPQGRDSEIDENIVLPEDVQTGLRIPKPLMEFSNDGILSHSLLAMCIHINQRAIPRYAWPEKHPEESAHKFDESESEPLWP